MERNAPCPCGSGKKYKRCCALKKDKMSGTAMLLILLVVLAGAAALAMAIVGNTGESARPGQVWSPEHGHWHNLQ